MRALTCQAMTRKMLPAMRNALQPAIASARGERLGGCRFLRSTASPAAAPALESFGREAAELAATQDVLVNLYALGRNAQQVERIGFRARSRRRRRPRLHHERGKSGDAIRGMPDARCVQMARKQHVDAAIRELLERHERMVRYNHRHDLAARSVDLLAHVRNLLLAHAAPFEDERARGIYAEDGDLLVDELGRKLGADIAPVSRQRKKKPPDDIVKRHVVIARDDELRLRQPVEVGARLAKMPRARAPREIARNDEEMRRELHELARQRLEHAGCDAPEMQIRNVRDPPHGTMTLSDRGRMRYSSGVCIGVTSPSCATRSCLRQLATRRLRALMATKSSAWRSLPKRARSASMMRSAALARCVV